MPIPARYDPVKDIVVFPFLFKLADREVKTGYGTSVPPTLHDVAYFTGLARTAGFTEATQREHGTTFFLDLRKPAATSEPSR